MKRVITLSASELLSLWRSRRLYEPPAAGGATVVRTDSPAIDALLMSHIRSAYAMAIESASPDELPLTEIAPQLSLAVDRYGVGSVSLPAGVIRVCSLMCEGWRAPARIVDPTDTAMVARQANRYSRGGTDSPVAVVLPDRMFLYSFERDVTPCVISCMAAVEPGPADDFIFTPSLLSKTLSYDLS